MLTGVTTLAGVAALAALAIAVPAQAAPSHGPGYPAFAHEGRYPDATPCNYRLQQSRTGVWGGRRIALKYFYTDGCGSFARIDNAPRDCVALLDRSTDGGRTWAWIQETVDPGISFAYMMVGNNLSGRVSRAALARGPSAPRKVIVRTSW